MHRISSRPNVSTLNRPLLTIQKYSCSFLPYDTQVYNIVAPKKSLYVPSSMTMVPRIGKEGEEDESVIKTNLQLAHYKDVIFFTTPLTKRFNGEVENVLVSFLCPNHAEFVKNDVMVKTKLPLQVCKMSLKDYSYHGTLLKTPLITIIKGMCSIDGENGEKSEQYELFYTSRYLSDVDDYHKNGME